MQRRRQQRGKTTERAEDGLRIIGGHFRGRRLAYDGQPATRPMKDRVREALFSLIGPEAVRGSLAVDLFAGTGALALESLSRGARRAVVLECNFTTIETLRDNAVRLNVQELVDLVPGDSFYWADRLELPQSLPWLVFCSPPYRLYVERRDDLLRLLNLLWDRAPIGSTFVVESDKQFDFRGLPESDTWKRRSYPPAELGWATKVNREAPIA
jgi:16S rRNA (guanine966-N2)-methyltransferase